MTGDHSIEDIALSDVFVIPGRRDTNLAAVERLAESLAKIGLQEPIKLRLNDVYVDPIEGEITGALTLVAGRHRLEAARSLGWETIPATVLTISDVEARLIEIAENLHRNELTALERSEQIAEWIDLTEPSVVSAQNAPKLGRPEAGINRASRELGIERTEAQRSSGVASLSPDAKETAKVVGLDDNRSALLEAARKPTEDQAATLHAIKAAGSVSAFKARQKLVKSAPEPLNDFARKRERQVERLIEAWGNATDDARDEFALRCGLTRPILQRCAS